MSESAPSTPASGPYRLSRGPRRLVLALHLLSAAAWIGGIVGLVVLSVALPTPRDTASLASIRHAMKVLDYGIIVPACFGSLGTGLLFMALTQWGFVRHPWVMVKWSATIVMIAFGAAFLGPWVDQSAALAAELDSNRGVHSAFSDLSRRVTLFAILQLALLVGLVFLSAFKPWGRRGKASRT